MKKYRQLFLVLIMVIIIGGCSGKPKSNTDTAIDNNVIKDGYITVYKEHKAGLINENSQVIIDFQYDYCFYAPTNKTVLVAKDGIYDEDGILKNSQWGVIDIKGNTLIDFDYSRLYTMNKDQYLAYKNKKCGILDKKGNVLIDINYDKIIQAGTDYIVQKDGTTDKYGSINSLSGSYGMFDSNGTEIIPTEYQFLYKLTGTENQFVAKKDEKYGVIDRDNKVILDFIYDDFNVVTKQDDNRQWQPVENLIIASKEGKTGVMDYSGKEVVPFIYDASREDDYFEGISYNKELNVFEVIQNGKYGVADLKGNILVDCQYKTIEMNENSMLGVNYNSEDDNFSYITKDYYYLDTNGKEKFSLKAKNATPFDSKGISIVSLDGKEVMMNTSGEEIIGFDEIIDTDVAGLYWVKVYEEEGVQNGMVDESGNYIIPLNFYTKVLATNKMTILNTNFTTRNIKDFTPFILVAQRETTEQIGKLSIYDTSGKILSNFDGNLGTRPWNTYYSTGMVVDVDYGTMVEGIEENSYIENNYFNSKTDGHVYGLLGYDGKMLIEQKYIAINEANDYYLCMSKSGDVLVDKTTGKIKLTLKDGMSFVRDYEEEISDARNAYE